MTSISKLSRFIREWAGYLQDNGHLVAQSLTRGAASTFDLVSIDRQGKALLWKVSCSSARTKRFQKSEMAILRTLTGVARHCRARPYVVVRFDVAEPRATVVSVQLVLNARKVESDKGGIQWPPESETD